MAQTIVYVLEGKEPGSDHRGDANFKYPPLERAAVVYFLATVVPRLCFRKMLTLR